MERGLPDQLGDQPAAADAPHHAVTIVHAGLLDQAAHAFCPRVLWRRYAGDREFVDLRFRLPGAEAVEAALAGDGEELIISGQEARDGPLDFRPPGDRPPPCPPPAAREGWEGGQLDGEDLVLCSAVEPIARPDQCSQ